MAVRGARATTRAGATRRILLPATADDAIWQDRVGSFLQALGLLGWTIGRNVRIDTRWATNNAAEIRRHALELAALAPDAILAGGTSSIAPLLQATRTVPIVFTIANDPVGAGFVATHGRGSGMSVAGAKQTSQRHGSMSALRVKRTFT